MLLGSEAVEVADLMSVHTWKDALASTGVIHRNVPCLLKHTFLLLRAIFSGLRGCSIGIYAHKHLSK